MRTTLVMHILAGALGIISGFVALYVAKGGTLHRRSGMYFFYAMLVMTSLGLLMAIARGAAPGVNVPAALLTAYLVVTGFTTVRPRGEWSQWVDVGGVIVALGVGLTMTAFGVEAIAAGGKRHGIPAFPFIMFAVVGLLGSVGDIRVMRSGALRGAERLARHLWRMSFALFIATMSFFIGQAKVIPKPYRIMPLLALPVLAVLVTMVYWMWRVRVRRTVRGMTVVRVPRAA